MNHIACLQTLGIAHLSANIEGPKMSEEKQAYV
jgi:hypothetical protein